MGEPPLYTIVHWLTRELGRYPNGDFSDGADPVRLPKFRHRSAAPKVGALTIQGIFAFGPRTRIFPPIVNAMR